MGPESIRAGITVDDRLHFGRRLNLDIDWNSIWQILLGRACNILRKALHFRLAVELRRNRNMHPRKRAVLVLSLSRYTAEVREEILNLALKVGETGVVILIIAIGRSSVTGFWQHLG